MSYLAPLMQVPELLAGDQLITLVKKSKPILEYVAVTAPTWIIFFSGH